MKAILSGIRFSLPAVAGDPLNLALLQLGKKKAGSMTMGTLPQCALMYKQEYALRRFPLCASDEPRPGDEPMPPIVPMQRFRFNFPCELRFNR